MVKHNALYPKWPTWHKIDRQLTVTRPGDAETALENLTLKNKKTNTQTTSKNKLHTIIW